MTADDAADIEAALRELAKHGRVFALRLESLADLIARAQMPGLTPRAVAREQPDEMVTTDGDDVATPAEGADFCPGDWVDEREREQPCERRPGHGGKCGPDRAGMGDRDAPEHADAAEPPPGSHPFAVAIPPAPPAVEEQTTLTDIVLARTGCLACAGIADGGSAGGNAHTCDPIPFGEERRRPDGSAEPDPDSVREGMPDPLPTPREQAKRDRRARKPAAPWEPSATTVKRLLPVDAIRLVDEYRASLTERKVKAGDRDFLRWYRGRL